MRPSSSPTRCSEPSSPRLKSPCSPTWSTKAVRVLSDTVIAPIWSRQLSTTSSGVKVPPFASANWPMRAWTPGWDVSANSFATKLTRSTSAPLSIHSSASCHPSTVGGFRRPCPHEKGLLRHFVDAEGRPAIAARRHDRADNVLDRPLHSRVPGRIRLEVVGVEQGTEHGLDLVVRGE